VKKRSWPVAGHVAAALAAAGGVSIATFSHVHNVGLNGQLNGMAASTPADRSRITILLFTDGASTLAHELGHCLFLPHAPTAPYPGMEIAGVMVQRHVAGNDRCLMSYSLTRPGFCAICLLRLRGANGDHLKPGGITP
jgi:hypothetical protein